MTADNIYQILSRPEFHQGSVTKQTEETWIWRDNKIVKESITFVPDLYNLFNEILIHAANHKQRGSSLNCISVDINSAMNLIRFRYNGDGIHVDNIRSLPIFLSMIKIEASDGKRICKQVLKTTDDSTMTTHECTTDEKWIMVSFTPALAICGMESLEGDIVSLMKRRVFEISGCLGKGVEVILDGTRVPVESFEDCAKLYLTTDDSKSFYGKVNDRLEICVALANGTHDQVTFLDYYSTTMGESHDCISISDQITTYLGKIASLEPELIKSSLWVFVNALHDNPAFDSQTKENLTTNKGSFGSTFRLTSGFLKKLAISKMMDELMDDAETKKTNDKREKELIIPELVDACFAGTSCSEECTLILTEGDYGRRFAQEGISTFGSAYYGVFPFKGMLLNAREASSEKVLNSDEVQKIMKILGLELGQTYNNVKGLRYGHLMIMSDEDYDGSYFKGQLINFFHFFWPTLLEVSDFMLEFIAPIVKASNEKNKEVFLFYTMPEYEAWKKKIGNEATKYKINYWKGFGTSEEAAECFANLDIYTKIFCWKDKDDSYAIKFAFDKKIKARKDWLRVSQAGTYFDSKQKHIRYRDFINKRLIPFSSQRSIPSMVDGLKPGQREILFFALKEPNIEDIKVSHPHNVARLVSMIIGMAQNYVGSNNVNLLQPKGQFGTRLMGGKDCAPGSYISTGLSPITRYIFHKADELLLNYLNDDGQSIEPAWFIPIIPMVLVNGSKGEGLGWSSFIPNYNPRDIIANLKRLLNGEAMVPIHPWYKGFKGTIKKKTASEGYTTTGNMKKRKNSLRITELPVGMWTQKYKQFLDKTSFIEAYASHNDDETVLFNIFMTEDQMNTTDEDLLKKFKLTTTLSTSNMYLFDAKGLLKKYDTPEQILEEFSDIRLKFYEMRRGAELRELKKASLLLLNKVRYISLICEGKINLMDSHGKLLADLEGNGLKKETEVEEEVNCWLTWKAAREEKWQGDASKTVPRTEFDYLLSSPGELLANLEDKSLKKETEVEEEVAAGKQKRQGNASKTVPETEYDYLLSLDPRSLTYEKKDELQKKMVTKEEKIDMLLEETSRSLWILDLEALDRLLILDGNYPSAESSSKVAEEAQKKKAHAKRVAASPSQNENKKRRLIGE